MVEKLNPIKDKLLPQLTGDVVDIGHRNGLCLFEVFRHYRDANTLSPNSLFVGIDSAEVVDTTFASHFEMWCELREYDSPFTPECETQDKPSDGRFLFPSGESGHINKYNKGNDTCDIVLAINSLHFDGINIPQAIKKVHNWLKKGGLFYARMYVEMPSHKWEYGKIDYQTLGKKVTKQLIKKWFPNAEIEDEIQCSHESIKVIAVK